MKVYFTSRELVEYGLTGAPKHVGTRLDIVAVNYVPDNFGRVIEVPDDAVDGLQGYQIIDTLVKLKIVKPYNHFGTQYIVPGELFEAYEV